MRVSALLCVTALFATSLIAAVASPVQEARSATGVSWQPAAPWDGARLTIDGPGGIWYTLDYPKNSTLSFGLKNPGGGTLPDGQYTYQLVLAPPIDVMQSGVVRQARQSGEVNVNPALATPATGSPDETNVVTGSFMVLNGTIVSRDLAESSPHAAGAGRPPTHSDAVTHPGTNDVVVPDDQIVQGSLCVGLDCVNNESFGFDTIRLKENNTRIAFSDSSTGTGFPTVDWQLTANDSASGGLDKFSIEDISNAKVPFTVQANAPTNSLFLDSSGRLGLRTATPGLDLHIATGNTPAIRLEQNGGGGFTAQTWDIGANEANFFVRDLTGGSRLPFRIRPGAPTSSVDIAATGFVGINTAAPAYTLDVKGDLRVTGNLIAGTSVIAGFKSGIITPGQFSGNPPTASVTFASPFPDTSYVISLTPLSTNGKLVFNALNKTAAGFQIRTDKTATGLQELDWIATKLVP